MKRFFIILSILSIVLLFSIFACKKVNLLSPTYIPDETIFRVPNNDNTLPSKIDVNPTPAKNGEVFGGFIRKFQYKGEWHILATNKYYYDATNKILTEKGKQFLLKFNKDGDLSILNGGNPINNDIWNHLTNFNIIENSQVWYIDNSWYYHKYGEYYVRRQKMGSADYSGSWVINILKNNISYNSEDLLNWSKKGKEDSEVMKFPLDRRWQGPGTVEYAQHGRPYHIILFKEKLYVFDGGKGIDVDYDKNTNDRNISQFKFIDWNNRDKASEFNNWILQDYPWGKESYCYVYTNEDRLYIMRYGNYIWGRDKNQTELYPRSIEYYDYATYSTTGATGADGKIIWINEGKGPPKNADYVGIYRGSDAITAAIPRDLPTATPEPPDWAFDKDNKRYYKVATNYSGIIFNGKHYSLPIPPVNEIQKAADSGKTNFTITEQHIENSGKNQFMVSLVNPTNAKESDWKLITPLEYTGYSMIWQIGGGNTLFNINGKTIQLLDYCEMQNFLNYNNSVYNPIINELRRKAETERSKSQYYNAMYYEAQADILERIL
ncbi:hypothetical protein, partial [Brachyspira catarrhinii]